MSRVNPYPRAILFDLDGTLADTVPQLALAAQKTAKLVGIKEPSLEQTKSYVGNGINMLLARVIAGKFDIKQEDIDSQLLKKARKYFDDIYCEGLSENFRLYDGVKEGLESLKQQGLKLAVVTNKPQIFAMPLLKFMGVYEYFDFILGGEILDDKKPSPKPINFVLEKLEVEPRDAIMVGDSENDILAGNNAFMRTVFLSYGYNHKPESELRFDYKFDNFSDFIDLLK